MRNVEAVPISINGQTGYDIRILSEEATVQDYIDAIERFIEEGQCFRSRVPGLETCFACDLCCQERIPVTLVDALNLKKGSLRDTFEKYFYVYVEDRIVDITMRLNSQGRCCNLDSGKSLCADYHRRPLVCRTFICCPSTGNAKSLREVIVNCGEDELVRSWFRLKGPDGIIINEAFSPRPDPADYPKTAFYGSTKYSRVKLKNICSTRLWEKIYRPAKTNMEKEVSG